MLNKSFEVHHVSVRFHVFLAGKTLNCALKNVDDPKKTLTFSRFIIFLHSDTKTLKRNKKTRNGLFIFKKSFKNQGKQIRVFVLGKTPLP